MATRRFVMLDRDGTLIAERHYLRDPDEVELLPNAARGLRRLRAEGFGLVVITNQSPVGRGLLTPWRLERIHRRMCQLLEREQVWLDGIYYCPHTPADGCRCRKPRTGLIERAAADFAFHAGDAFMIGDKPCDLEAGRRAGATAILVRTGYGMRAEQQAGIAPDQVADDLLEAAEIVSRRETRRESRRPGNWGMPRWRSSLADASGCDLAGFSGPSSAAGGWRVSSSSDG